MGKYLTRRANQRHSFIIAQSVKRTPGRAMAATAVNVKLILPPRQSRGVSRIICAAGRKVRRFCAEHDPETRTGFQKNMLEQRDEIVFRSNLIGT